MQTTQTPTQAPESVEPPSSAAIDNWLADLCKAMEKDLKIAEKHRTQSWKAGEAKKNDLAEKELNREVIRRAEKHLPEARAFIMGFFAKRDFGYIKEAHLHITVVKFYDLKKQVESYMETTDLTE